MDAIGANELALLVDDFADLDFLLPGDVDVVDFLVPGIGIRLGEFVELGVGRVEFLQAGVVERPAGIEIEAGQAEEDDGHGRCRSGNTDFV